jgi:glycosyltransferase involved in cell wall biosynthesis
VGDGPDSDALIERADELGLERIMFHGRQDPVPYYRKARFLLMTSDFEGFPMVLVEAQAFGCVPVVFNCFSAVNDIIDNDKTGLIVPRGDVIAFAQSLDAVMSDPERIDRMSSMAVDSVARFTSNGIAGQWLQMFREHK